MKNDEAGHRTGVPPSSSPVVVSTTTAVVPTRRHLRRAARWRLPLVPLAIALVCLVGAGLLLYPTAAAWLSQYEQSMRIIDLDGDITDLGEQTLRERVDEARAYNAAMTDPGASVAANERLPLADVPEQDADYSSLLAADEEGLMARIKIASIGLDLPIYHGTSEWVLEHGIGHLEGTALPVGGESTHSVLTGHRGLATAELFTHLDRVVVDDTITIEVFGEVLVYRVVTTEVVEPEDTQSLDIRSGRDLITLVTCTPLGINSHRILVTAERVIPTPDRALDEAGRNPDIPSFPWWAILAGGIILAVAAYVWWSGRPPRIRAPRSPLALTPPTARAR